MVDDLTRKAPEDPTKINVNQSWEIQYWAKKLGVTEQQLKTAVKAVGPIVKDVKRYLKVWKEALCQPQEKSPEEVPTLVQVVAKR